MKSYDYRNSMEFKRTNTFIDDSEFPFVYSQNIDLKDLQIIGFDKTSSTPFLGGVNKQNKTVHFFLDDYKFDEVWNTPEKQAKKLMQYKQLLGPDFSTYANMPKKLQKYNVFRSRWCCAYWQKLGMAVIPTITWSTPDSFEWCFKGVEKGAVLAISTVGCYDVQDKFVVAFEEMCEQLEPRKVINYGKVFEGMEKGADILAIPYKFIRSDYNDDEYYEELNNPEPDEDDE